MEECVPKNEICTFNIFDSFGDGLCCRFGEGSYTVEKNGRRVGQGAQFTNEESVYFCDGTPPAPPSDCADNEVSLTVELTTDKFPGETTWVVFDEDSGDVEASGGPYTEKETLHTVTSCIPRDTCLFKIMDSQNDGICCGVSHREGKPQHLRYILILLSLFEIVASLLIYSNTVTGITSSFVMAPL